MNKSSQLEAYIVCINYKIRLNKVLKKIVFQMDNLNHQ